MGTSQRRHSWVQSIPSVPADQPPLFNIEEEEEIPQSLPKEKVKD